MTVGELIEKLQTYDRSAIVCIYAEDCVGELTGIEVADGYTHDLEHVHDAVVLSWSSCDTA